MIIDTAHFRIITCFR